LEDHTGAAIDFVFYGQEVLRRVVDERDALREVVAQQSVGVFVAAALPG
jgi:hypothetical protein